MHTLDFLMILVNIYSEKFIKFFDVCFFYLKKDIQNEANIKFTKLINK